MEIIVLARNVKPNETLVLYKHQRSRRPLTFHPRPLILDSFIHIWTSFSQKSLGYLNSKDHWRFGPYTPIFLIPRTLILSFWCDACSISAIGESNNKSQLAKYFQNSYALERYGVRKGRGSEISWQWKLIWKVISALFNDLFGRHGDIYWTYHMQSINESRY